MSLSQDDLFQNRLLSLMSAADLDLLKPHLVPVEMPRGFVLCETRRPVEHVYFMTSGIGSIIVRSPEGREAEGGLFGREGMAPIDVVLGSDQSAHRIVVQVGGAGWRMREERLIAAVTASESLRLLLLRYAQTLNVQAGFTALSNAVHPVDERSPAGSSCATTGPTPER